MSNPPEERRCEGCAEKITKVAQRVDLMESELDRMKKDQVGAANRFEAHMEKEEVAFKSFYEALGQLENRISTIVMDGLKDITGLKESVRGEIEKSNARFISRKEAMVAIATAAIVSSVIIFAFTNFESDSKKDSELSGKIDVLIQEMKRAN